jgi:hypothetical protein
LNFFLTLLPEQTVQTSLEIRFGEQGKRTEKRDSKHYLKNGRFPAYHLISYLTENIIAGTICEETVS